MAKLSTLCAERTHGFGTIYCARHVQTMLNRLAAPSTRHRRWEGIFDSKMEGTDVAMADLWLRRSRRGSCQCVIRTTPPPRCLGLLYATREDHGRGGLLPVAPKPCAREGCSRTPMTGRNQARAPARALRCPRTRTGKEGAGGTHSKGPR